MNNQAQQKGSINDIDQLFKDSSGNQQQVAHGNKGTVDDIHNLFQQSEVSNSDPSVKDLGTQPTITFKSKPVEYEKPSFLADVGSGMDKIFSGIKQGALYAKDAVTGGNDYDKFTKQKADERAEYEKARQASGAGLNVGEFLGETVATAPIGAFAKGFQGAKILSGAGAKVLGQNALLGAGAGATQFAKDSDDRTSNAVLGAIGGAGGATIAEKGGQAVTGVVRKLQNRSTNMNNIDDVIAPILHQHNINIGDLPEEFANSLRKNAVSAIRSNKTINEDALVRQAKLGELGLKGTQAQITRNPQQWQKEAELAKVSGGDALRNKHIDDDSKLNNLMSEASDKTGGTAVDQYGAMQNVVNAAKNKLDSSKENYKSLYNRAYRADGNDVQLNGAGFANDAITQLDKDYALSSLPPSVNKILNDVSQNTDRFTLGKSEELIKILNREHKASLNNGQKTSSTYAIGIVRDALNNRREEAMQGLLSSGNDAASLYSAARNATSQHHKMIEGMPLLQDVQKGIKPDEIFTKHFLNTPIDNLHRTATMLKENDPQALRDVQQQMIDYISRQSMNNDSLSPAKMKKVLDKLGDRRLGAIFEPQEIKQLKDIHAAAFYLKGEPANSHVNHSNTASALSNFLFDRVLGSKGLRILAKPVNDFVQGGQANKAINANVAGQTVPRTERELTVLERLAKAGLISGANVTQQ